MVLTLTRYRPTLACQPGALSLDGAAFCRTLERRPGDPEYAPVPAGTYAVTIEPTHNPRLWTPHPDRCLPRLHGVPGRSGILVHAGNAAADTEGCILVGLGYYLDALSQSRVALASLMDRLRAAGAPHSIVIVDPVPETPPGA